MVTLTATSTNGASFDNVVLSRQGEVGVSLTVVVPAVAIALSHDAYLDFQLPDGTVVYKGAYDCTSGSFVATIGGTDAILSQAGDLYVQLCVRDQPDETATILWKSERAKITVTQSVNASVPASIEIVPPLTMPATYPAETVTLTDAGGLITATNTEDALQEIATPSNILTKIKTVDGTGSGLDADLLDGIEVAALMAKSLLTTAGDIIFATGSATPARLGMTANQKLFANAAGTAPEWSGGFKIGNFTRDLTAATGDVSTTGVGFKPNLVIFFLNVNGQFQFSIYFAVSASSHGGVNTSAAGIFYSGGYLRAYIDGSNYHQAVLKTMDTDGFTLTWTKTGSPTGTATINYIALR